MPELPEVETVVRALGPQLTGRSIKCVDVRAPSSIAGSPRPLRAVCGKRIEGVRRRGKYILLDCSGNWALAVHLRMTGWLGLRRRGALEAGAEPYVRVAFGLDGPQGAAQIWLVFRDVRRFGRIWCARREELLALRALAKLGPDPLEITREDFARRLRARRGRLKSLLLNQTLLAGLGNIYADEALFQARLHPRQEARKLSRPACGRLHTAMRDVLRRALAAGGSSIDDYRHPDGRPGWFQRELKAYGRAGEACVRCGRHIRRVVVAQRGTWYCPHCQRRRY